jgi:hypothetical protein
MLKEEGTVTRLYGSCPWWASQKERGDENARRSDRKSQQAEKSKRQRALILGVHPANFRVPQRCVCGQALGVTAFYCHGGADL